MADTVIQVENLGKKYILGHQQEGHSRYVALRDVVSEGAKSVVRRRLHPGKRRPNPNQEEFWALKDVSFEVKQGEVVGIIGRNGAGKSTLLKILSRITEPTTGRIKLRGRVASLLEVGTGFHPELTGRENIFLNGAILGMSRAEINRKFDEIVEFAEVSRFLDTPVKRYSSGMYVRLAFAVAAHLEPEILVVDEVLAVGDAAFQKKCLGKMKSVSTQDGRTVLFVSHSMGSINQLCTSAMWINSGQVQSQGSPQEISEQYLSSGYQSETRIMFQPKSNVKGQISSVTLFNSDCIEASDFSCGENITVQIMFMLNEKIRGLHIACIVTTSEGYHLFSSADTDTNKQHFNERIPGHYKVEVSIPTKLFNAGIYHLAVGMGIPGVESIDRQEAVSFTLHDTGDFGTMKEGLRRTGILLMELPWNYV